MVQFTKKKDFGKFVGWLADAGLVTPDYKVQIKLDSSKLPAGVKSVTWLLPDYFEKKKVTVTNPAKDFALDVDAWTSFLVGAEINLIPAFGRADSWLSGLRCDSFLPG